MPNGGSDNCGTCWFNAQNNGEAPSVHDPVALDAGYCTMRSFPIEHPICTYCNNHPKHRAVRDTVAIGPVWVLGPKSPGYVREILIASPDTEEIRLHLLELLREIQESPPYEYGTIYTDEVVVWQLGQFRESRAIPELVRIAAFDPTEKSTREVRARARIVKCAKEALAKIRG